MKKSNLKSNSEKDYTNEPKTGEVEIIPGQMVELKTCGGLFAARTPDEKYILVYCGRQVNARKFETPESARNYAKRNAFEILPMMSACLVQEMLTRKIIK